jgi:hypothetical protein
LLYKFMLTGFSTPHLDLHGGEPMLTRENANSTERPAYMAPTITTMTETELLDVVGPAQAYTGSVPFGF